MLYMMTYARITFESILNEYQKGDEYVIDLLEQRVNETPQVIKKKRITNNILSCIREYVNNH